MRRSGARSCSGANVSVVAVNVSPDLERVQDLSVREAAKVLRVPASRVYAERQRVFGKPLETGVQKPTKIGLEPAVN